ncbi:glycosyltransferase family 2 protein [Flavobacterium flavipallidum]|uniref:Glycosyltransferase family 2 protein n=1 Tax=Flavobacterium flavipallidum TaxID=3139140 RepID=A0ABU9HJR8_9FLAO
MVEKKPLISVVLPVYNVALYIEESVASILNQTVTDFELLIIDDCSTDNTLSIIEEIKDNRIKIITKEKNSGLIHSLNLGFKLAKGKYIARMDGDDISVNNRFEKQLEVLENDSNVKVCGCWLQEFGKSNRLVRHKEYHEEIKARLLLSCSMSMGAVMLEREWIGNVLFDATKKHVEDYDFWSRIAWTGKFYNIQEPLYLYRVHEMQVSTQYKSIQLQGDIEIKLFLFKKLKYDSEIFPDELIAKVLLLDKHIQVKELVLFIKWLKELILLNNKQNVFSEHELKKVLNEMLQSLLFTLYFKPTDIGINKKWRIKALFKLPFKNASFILKLKSREVYKLLFK